MGRIIILISFGLVCIGGNIAGADVAGSKEAISYMNATVSAVENAAKHAKQGDDQQVSLHARQAIEHAKQAINAMPMGDPHGREASSLLKEAIMNLDKAIERANGGSAKEATDHVNSALDFADAAILHVRHSH